jgi:glycerol-3-phosphate O-acyltransferase
VFSQSYFQSVSHTKLIDYILNQEKIKNKIQNKEQDKKRVLEIIEEMRTEVSISGLNTIRIFLDKTLMKLYSGINFDVPKDMDLPDLVKKNNVIFVLNHQSHADYLVFNYIFFVKYGMGSLVAGGLNLNIFPIGTIFKKAGCFFIRRSFQHDILYKLTLEAYLGYLLSHFENPIEFFFEGGRSRTGRLLPPKFGLFQMLIDTHAQLLRKPSFENSNDNNNGPHNKPLLFVPVTIAHELIPEQKSLAQEVAGKKKKRENFFQLLKLYQFLSKNFGTVHLKMGSPIEAKFNPATDDIKQVTQNLAFECFRRIGQGMVVTPSSLISLILLDASTGGLSWEDISKQASSILNFCHQFEIPLAPSLENNNWEESLKKMIIQFIDNLWVREIHNSKLKQTFYVASTEHRVEIIYFKNMILHHFLVPFFMSSALSPILTGQIKNAHELKVYLFSRRKELKYEFYLPTMKEMFVLGFKIVNFSTGKKVESFEECFQLSFEQLTKLLKMVLPFGNAFRSIYEGYYIAALTLKNIKEQSFGRDEFQKYAKEIFDMELSHGRFIRSPESYSTSMMNSSLTYFHNQKLVSRIEGRFHVEDMNKVDVVFHHYAKTLTDLMTASLQNTFTLT